MDLVGGNDGTLENGATYGAGQFGQAFNLDGSDDYVEFGDVLNEIDVPFTVEAWIYTPGGTNNMIFTSDEGPNYDGITLYAGIAGWIEISYGDGGAPGPSSRRTKVSLETIEPNVWTHVAAVVRGPTDMTIYIDGNDAGGTYSGSGGALFHGTGAARLGVGRHELNWFEGSIDDAAVYDFALSEAQVQAIVAGGLSQMCQP